MRTTMAVLALALLPALAVAQGMSLHCGKAAKCTTFVNVTAREGDRPVEVQLENPDGFSFTMNVGSADEEIRWNNGETLRFVVDETNWSAMHQRELYTDETGWVHGVMTMPGPFGEEHYDTRALGSEFIISPSHAPHREIRFDYQPADSGSPAVTPHFLNPLILMTCAYLQAKATEQCFQTCGGECGDRGVENVSYDGSSAKCGSGGFCNCSCYSEEEGSTQELVPKLTV